MLPTQAQDSVNRLPPKCDSAIVCAAHRYRRRARVRLLPAIVVCVILCAAVLLIGTWVLFYATFNSAQRRGYILRGYAFAFGSFAEAGKPIPNNLADFIVASNPAHEEYSWGWINPDWPVPEYHPAGHLDKGPYLVLILRPQAWNDGGMAVVLYAYPNGKEDTITVLGKDDLEIALRDDDRRRAVGRPSTGPS